MNSFPQVGDILEGAVVRVYPNYAILLFDNGCTGLLHISELSYNFVRSFQSFVKVGSIYQTKVIEADETKRAVKVSLKQMTSRDHNKALKRKKIDPSEIDFSALEANLADWIKAENAQGDKHD